MKLTISSFCTLLICLVVTSLSAQVVAEGTIALVWKDHGIGFTVPADFKELTSTTTEFSAGNLAKTAGFLIKPLSNEEVSRKGSQLVLSEQIQELKYDNISKIGEIDLNGFKGSLSKGKKDDWGAVVAVMQNLEVGKSLLFIASFKSDNDEQIVQDIFKSIHLK